MKRALYIFFLVSYVSLFAQAPKKFYTRFGGYGHEVGYGVIQTLNGQYAVAGSTSSFGNGNTDMYLALVDSMGWVRWEKSFGGFNNDIGRSIIQLKDSGFVMAGYTNSFGSGGYDMYVVRTDKNGNFIWQKTIGGIDWDFAYCVKESNGGDSVIVCGNTYSYGYGKSDGYIVKLDPAGNVMWTKTFGGSEDDEFKSIVISSTNNYFFAGTTKSMGDTKGDCWFFKSALSGDSLLSMKYGDNKKQYLNDIAEAVNTNLVMAGATDTQGKDSTYGYLLSLDVNGNLVYENNFPRSEKYHDFQLSTLTRGNGNSNFVYVYKTYNSPVNSKVEPLFMDVNGMWPTALTTYGSTEDDEIFDISKCKDKGYIAVGSTKGFFSNLTDVFLVKLDSTIFGSTKIVSINEHNYSEVENIRVYPTISTAKINIETPAISSPLSFTVIDVAGSVLLRSRLLSGHSEIDVNNLPEGMYFIVIDNKGKNKTFKFIKSN